jgi:UDP-glucose 4-epimerase
MSNKKVVLVTGNAGFIASHIADELLRNNYHVVGIDNLKNGKTTNINPKVDFYNIDLNHIHAVESILKKYKPNVLVHHASNLVDVSLSVRYPWRAHKDTVMTTKLLEKAQRHGLEHVIYASSANVYGNQTALPIQESFPVQPLSPYGLAKTAIEEYVAYISTIHNITHCIFRYFNVYGPRQSLRYKPVIPTFIHNLLTGKRLVMHGGMQTRDFVFVTDVARANRISCDKKATGIYNIGSGKQIQITQVVAILEKLTNKTAVVKHLAKDISDYDFSHASIEKAYKQLGWSPEVALEDGLKQTVKYYAAKKTKSTYDNFMMI